MTAVSAVVASLGLTGVVLLAVAPMTTPRANAANAAVADPTSVEPEWGDVTDSGTPEPDPEVTVTVTQEPDPTVTKTRTVAPDPTKTIKVTKKPKPPASNTAPVVPPAATQPPPTSMPVLPTNAPVDSPTPPATESPVQDPQLSLAPVDPPSDPGPTPAASFEEPTPDSVPIEIRNASPEYDQLTLSRKLAIPGVLLAVLVMLGVLVFEGRMRRMAHAAAVRRAGPRSPGRHRGDPEMPPMPGYPIYQNGAAYAPIISFVPVHPGHYGDPQQQPYGYQYVYDPNAAFGQHGVPHPGMGMPTGMYGPAEPWPRTADPGATTGMPADPQQAPHGPTGTVQAPIPGAPAAGRHRGVGRFFRRRS
ncbi:hypothetical protein GCM10009677_35490 [Sphaerisporangium rubeum]